MGQTYLIAINKDSLEGIFIEGVICFITPFMGHPASARFLVLHNNFENKIKIINNYFKLKYFIVKTD